jgi:hypothetical protein
MASRPHRLRAFCRPSQRGHGTGGKGEEELQIGRWAAFQRAASGGWNTHPVGRALAGRRKTVGRALEDAPVKHSTPPKIGNAATAPALPSAWAGRRLNCAPTPYRRNGTTAALLSPARNAPHACMIGLRRSTIEARLYAASTGPSL